jgi:hypothetical protein
MIGCVSINRINSFISEMVDATYGDFRSFIDRFRTSLPPLKNNIDHGRGKALWFSKITKKLQSKVIFNPHRNCFPSLPSLSLTTTLTIHFFLSISLRQSLTPFYRYLPLSCLLPPPHIPPILCFLYISGWRVYPNPPCLATPKAAHPFYAIVFTCHLEKTSATKKLLKATRRGYLPAYS